MVRQRSDIYKHFTTLPDGRRKCNYCEQGHFYNKKTSTSSLWLHLETQHGHMVEESESGPAPLAPAQQEALNNALIRWIIADLQPFTTSDNPEFIDFITMLNSSYSLPCRQT